MLNFFVALFGGAYYIGKFIINKSKSQSVCNRNRKYEIIDSDIRKYNAHPRTLADGWVMLREISEELEELFGKNWRDIFLTTKGGFLNCYGIFDNPKREHTNYRCKWGIWAIAYNIWLSKQGYISDVEYQINNPEDFGSMKNYTWIKEYPVFENTQELLTKMFQIIERNMQKKHPDLNLGLWLYHSETSAGWTIRWSYRFEVIGCTPQKKPW